MSRGNHLDLMASGIKQYTDKCDEAPVGHIVHKQLIESIHVAPEVRFLRSRPGIGPAHRCHQSGADAVTGHIGERNQDSSFRENLPIEVVATRLVSGPTPS